MRDIAPFVLMLAVSASACGGGSPSAPSAPTPTPVAAAPPPEPAPTPLPVASPSPTPPPGPALLRSASIRGANGHSASGTVEIVQRGGSQTLEFRGDFRIDGGNNDVYLANETSRPGSGAINLGNLMSRTGAQSYEISGDGTRFRYVLIWCRPFQVPIGLGELR